MTKHHATLKLVNRRSDSPAAVICGCGYRHVHPATTGIDFLLRQCELHDKIETERDLEQAQAEAAHKAESDRDWAALKAERQAKRGDRKAEQQNHAQAWHHAMSKEQNPGLPKR